MHRHRAAIELDVKLIMQNGAVLNARAANSGGTHFTGACICSKKSKRHAKRIIDVKIEIERLALVIPHSQRAPRREMTAVNLLCDFNA